MIASSKWGNAAFLPFWSEYFGVLNHKQDIWWTFFTFSFNFSFIPDSQKRKYWQNWYVRCTLKLLVWLKVLFWCNCKLFWYSLMVIFDKSQQQDESLVKCPVVFHLVSHVINNKKKPCKMSFPHNNFPKYSGYVKVGSRHTCIMVYIYCAKYWAAFSHLCDVCLNSRLFGCN